VNATVPTALAVAGTALMAVAIFGPFHRSSKDDADQNVSGSVGSNGTSPWPALVEASAVGCDVPARIDLAEALGALRSVWSESILHQALETESDPGVRSAIAAALSSSQSLVT
jgi:hypothetical protein